MCHQKLNYNYIFVNSHYICTNTNICIYNVKLSTVIKSDPKAPFSSSTISRCRGGCHSFLWVAPFYPISVAYNDEC